MFINLVQHDANDALHMIDDVKRKSKNEEKSWVQTLCMNKKGVLKSQTNLEEEENWFVVNRLGQRQEAGHPSMLYPADM